MKSAPARSPVQDSIEQSAEIHAPVSRVWRALTDHNEFGAWFGVAPDGPFIAGEKTCGKVLSPGSENVAWCAVIQSIDPEQYFAFTWHPYAVDPAIDYAKETPTLVEFRLAPIFEPIPGSTRLTVTESGFSDIPEDRREVAFLRNSEGWKQQMKNIGDYVSRRP